VVRRIARALEGVGMIAWTFSSCCIIMQVEEGVAMILISECMGHDPGTLHVIMTSLMSTTPLDEEGRY
jgi:hypothetical protein